MTPEKRILALRRNDPVCTLLHSSALQGDVGSRHFFLFFFFSADSASNLGVGGSNPFAAGNGLIRCISPA